MLKQTNLPLFLSGDAESIEIEFKTTENDQLPRDIWQTISAYANSEGGRIIFGITPDGDMILHDSKTIDRLQQDFASLCATGFSSTISPEIHYSHGILVMYIPPSPAQLRPIYKKDKGAGRGTYIRIGSTNRQATDESIRRFSVAARGGAETLSYDEHTYLECFEISAIEHYIQLINSKKNNLYQDFTPEEILIKTRAITKDFYPTLFGLLAFGTISAPQEIIAPTINIVVTQYPGNSKVNEIDFRETYIDNREFGGNARLQFDEAFKFVKSKLPIRGTIDSSGTRRDYFIIPEVALREALANAIAHRDYSTTSAPIQIDIFSDRLEIINPGTSLVPIDEIEKAPSATRNPLLMNFLKDYGITDQKARGIRTIILSIKQARLQAPTFENIGQSFKATLFASAFISNTDKIWLNQFSAFALNDRQLTALTHVKNNPRGISNSEYRNYNSMTNVRDDKKANFELNDLVSKNILIAVGNSRARRYILNNTYQDE